MRPDRTGSYFGPILGAGAGGPGGALNCLDLTGATEATAGDIVSTGHGRNSAFLNSGSAGSGTTSYIVTQAVLGACFAAGPISVAVDFAVNPPPVFPPMSTKVLLSVSGTGAGQQFTLHAPSASGNFRGVHNAENILVAPAGDNAGGRLQVDVAADGTVSATFTGASGPITFVGKLTFPISSVQLTEQVSWGGGSPAIPTNINVSSIAVL